MQQNVVYKYLIYIGVVRHNRKEVRIGSSGQQAVLSNIQLTQAEILGVIHMKPHKMLTRGIGIRTTNINQEWWKGEKWLCDIQVPNYFQKKNIKYPYELISILKFFL